MWFLALIVSIVLARVMRGCAKYAVLAGLLAWISWKDPVLAGKLSDLGQQAFHALREWILTL